MERIEGVPILEHCRPRRLGTDARLEPFVQACHAIDGDGHPRIPVAISNLSLALAGLGLGDDALWLAEEALAGGRVVFGPESFAVGNFLGRRGRALEVFGRPDEAAAAMIEAHAILPATVGPGHEPARKRWPATSRTSSDARHRDPR